MKSSDWLRLILVRPYTFLQIEYNLYLLPRSSSLSKTILRRNLFNVTYLYLCICEVELIYLFIRSRLTTYTSKSVTKTRTMEIRRMKRYSQSLEKRSFTMNYSKKRQVSICTNPGIVPT